MSPETIQVFLIDHLGTAGHQAIAPVAVEAFKSGRYNGNAVIVLVNGEQVSDDTMLANGDRISVSAANNKGA